LLSKRAGCCIGHARNLADDVLLLHTVYLTKYAFGPILSVDKVLIFSGKEAKLCNKNQKRGPKAAGSLKGLTGMIWIFVGLQGFLSRWSPLILRNARHSPSLFAVGPDRIFCWRLGLSAVPHFFRTSCERVTCLAINFHPSR
jgi:hypothetical protein